MAEHTPYQRGLVVQNTELLEALEDIADQIASVLSDGRMTKQQVVDAFFETRKLARAAIQKGTSHPDL